MDFNLAPDLEKKAVFERIVAEIWQHTDLENSSDEEDIVRLQDDFGR